MENGIFTYMNGLFFMENGKSKDGIYPLFFLKI